MKSFITRGATALVICLGLSSAVQAAPITGTPLAHGAWVPNSTNALNYASSVPGREGQIAPHVLFNSSGAGFVGLDFLNYGPGLSFFEYRLDGVATGATPHPVIVGDTIHPGQTVSSGNEVLNRVFNASNYVDIRLALGGERDWDFDWVRFDVPGATVPAPAILPLVLIGLLGMGATARRRKLGRTLS